MIAERTKFSTAWLAARWGISPDKVLAWIRSGELKAINAATNKHGRPRFLIDVADIIAFEESRSSQTDSVPARVRRSPKSATESITKYF